MTTSKEIDSVMLDSLSAMFDDEASEQDLERLLEVDESLGKPMQAFHIIQQSLHQELAVNANTSVNLVSRVRAQIDQEDQQAALDHENQSATVSPIGQGNLASQQVSREGASSDSIGDETTSKMKSVWSLWPSLATAASVAIVVVFTGNYVMSPDTVPAQVATVETPQTNVALPVTTLSELNKQPLDGDNQRLQTYLRQHAEQATISAGQGIIPMARLVSYPTEE
ncbi:hypothetical protein MSP8886_02411 [Marinomonas spartinae]|uniref:Anti sigma-E protein RseA N-terminal domain-containing protein n=1 Tax=Marinomonas spartinae TaxID=1792290 RepID=A0A1A8TG35_9GAMM|nr:sigma-E factor negative regulatory protein [Marinomonas spartinae]SBS32391.1 hypothetical protein MSP8886_02411 [Marinomonas spartinae]